MHSCAGAVCQLEIAIRDGRYPADGTIQVPREEVAANVSAVRRAIGRRPGAPYRPVTQPSKSRPEGDDQDTELRSTPDQRLTALHSLDSAMGRLAEVFPTAFEHPQPGAKTECTTPAPVSQ